MKMDAFDYSPYDLLNRFRIGDVACLWCDLVPSLSQYSSYSATKVIGEAILGAVIDGEIISISEIYTNEGELIDEDKNIPYLEWMIPRPDLIKFATAREAKPLFLFKEERGQSSLEEAQFTIELLKIEIEKLKQENIPYLDSEHQYFSPELEAAVHVWMELFVNGGGFVEKADSLPVKSPRQQIEGWLSANRNLENLALQRIATVCNPKSNKR